MEIVVAIAVAALLAWAVWRTVGRSRRGGGCCGEHEAAEKRVPARDRGGGRYPYRAELDIGGMTCQNCARRVENALNALDGVRASVDISTHKARLRLKAPADLTALNEAVMKAGYAVLGASESKSAF